MKGEMQMKTNGLRQLCAMGGGGESVRTLAHDLRTPMCCVSGAAQMALLAAEQGKAVDSQLRQILLAVNAMDRLLTQACDPPQSEQNASAQALEDDLRMMIGPGTQQKQQLLAMDLHALYDVPIAADGTALSRVLLNLLSNAVKYTPPGGLVELYGALRNGQNGEGLQAVFTIRDSGMGMKRDFLRRMYRPFARARESAQLPGTGLGLSIVRRLVRQMGGTIRVKSAWGRGTVFTVCVPVAAK